MIIDFEYAGERLSEHGLIIASIDVTSGANTLEWGSQLEFNTVQNKNSGISYSTSTNYTDVYTTTFQTIKYSCKSGSMTAISDTEFRYLTKWLNRKEYLRFSPISDNANFVGYYFYGSFNIKPIVACGEIIGVELTFTANTPFGFGDVIKIDENGTTFEVYTTSDELGKLPAKTTLKTSKSGNLTITNSFTGESTVVKNCKANETLYFDSEHLIITSDSNHTKLFNDFNYTYPTLYTDYTDTVNKFTLSMPCEIHMEFTPVRKVGVIV